MVCQLLICHHRPIMVHWITHCEQRLERWSCNGVGSAGNIITVVTTGIRSMRCRGSTLNMAKPGPEHLIVNCKHIFEQDKRPNYVSVLVLLLSLRYYISLWNPIGS